MGGREGGREGRRVQKEEEGDGKRDVKRVEKGLIFVITGTYDRETAMCFAGRLMWGGGGEGLYYSFLTG